MAVPKVGQYAIVHNITSSKHYKFVTNLFACTYTTVTNYCTAGKYAKAEGRDKYSVSHIVFLFGFCPVTDLIFVSVRPVFFMFISKLTVHLQYNNTSWDTPTFLKNIWFCIMRNGENNNFFRSFG